MDNEKKAFEEYLTDVPYADTQTFVELCGGHEAASAFYNGYIAGRDSQRLEISNLRAEISNLRAEIGRGLQREKKLKEINNMLLERMLDS